MTPLFPFEHTYAQLPEHFYARVPPTPVQQPAWALFNTSLASELGLDAQALHSDAGLKVLAGNEVPPNALPIAMAYSGHQFGHFSPQLGDGRALLLGEILAPDGARYDVQLKGSGPTPFSRRGDGRAALGPMLREYIISEAMHALGIPTTRSLAVVHTGEQVLRERPLPGAVLTRVASSHIRVGTFEYFAARRDVEGLHALADYTIARHAPALSKSAQPYLALLRWAVQRQTELVARWMGVGFIHGVMNTDNMALSGHTIDYGPCAFMDAYSPETVFSAIDTHGRYAYGAQLSIAQWNLACLAQALLPLLHEDKEQALQFARDALQNSTQEFETAWLAVMRRKLGLTTAQEGDLALIHAFLDLLAQHEADYTLSFRQLSPNVPDWCADAAGYHAWAAQWQARQQQEEHTLSEQQAVMHAVNPAYIPRNHRVEQALKAADHGDLSHVQTLLQILAKPYDDQPQHAAYQQAPHENERIAHTFCGT